MTDRLRAFFRGATSIFNIFPDPRRYEDLLPKGTVEERLHGHWKQVGQYIVNATGKFDDEIAAEKKSAPRKGNRRK